MSFGGIGGVSPALYNLGGIGGILSFRTNFGGMGGGLSIFSISSLIYDENQLIILTDLASLLYLNK